MILATTWIPILFLYVISIHCKLFEVLDKNEMKKILTSHSNILVSFIENDKIDENILSVLKEVANKGNKLAKLLIVNCHESKKLCKQYKAKPKSYELHHFHKGKFNKLYDRKFRVESILRFLEDPTGEIAWEEDETARDIVHVKGSQDLQRIVSNFKANIPSMMLMFYAPWCGYCKQMKPHFAAAATALKGKSIFIGINGDLSTTDDLKQAFNITGYPSVFLIQDGNKVFKYESENSKDAIIRFVHNPTKPTPQKDIPWSEETNEIDFLTDASFHDYLDQHESVLVMFYAPWCGHCKAMKPAMVDAAIQLRKLKIEAQIAAIDSTENKNTSEAYQIKGFPTVKYFKNAQFMYDVNERSADGLVKFLLDPKKPEEPKRELPWKEEESAVIHPAPEEFRAVLRRFKHSLVMFYAPWCGHCKATKPKFTSAANQMAADNTNKKVAFIGVDCTDQSFADICTSEGITGFPIFRYFNYGKNTSYTEYSLEREEEDFVAFMANPANPHLDARRHWRRLQGHEAVIILEKNNFVQNIVSHNSGALVMFYSPWCGHCIAMKPAFVNAANKLTTLLPSCLIAAVDATTETHLASQYKVSGFPTLIYFSPNGDWIKYTGERTEDAITDFMIKKHADNKHEEAEKLLQEERKKFEAEKKLKEEEEKKKIEAERKLKEERKKFEAERKLKEEEEKKKFEAEKKLKEEEERKKFEAERKLKEEEKKKVEAERKLKEEEEKKKIEAERKLKEEEKKKVEAERKLKEEEEKKKVEAERKLKEEEERKKVEAAKKLKEEKEKVEAERKLKEERKKFEAERKLKEEEEKKKVEAERKLKEEEERKKVEAAKKLKEEKEKVEAERKLKEERKKFEAERKLKEEEEKKKVEAERKLKEEKEKVEAEHKKEQITKSVPLNAEKSISFTELLDEESFEKGIDSERISIIYLHKDNKKSNIKGKLVKILNKVSKALAVDRYEVNCALAVSLCDQLNVVELPIILLYRNGSNQATFEGSWTEADLIQALDHSARDEL